jgi:hypothetical protein
MSENSMQKVRDTRGGKLAQDSAYKPSAPVNYRPPTPVKVPPPTAKGK